MKHRPVFPLYAATALAFAAALGVAGWLGTAASDATPVAPAAPARWMVSQFVEAVQGWLPVSATNPQPALDVRNCPQLSEVYDLAPATDAIPAILNPHFVRPAEVNWLSEREPVLGLKLGGAAHCYPVRLMNYHSLVHDQLGGQAVYVFWDPPSGVALARRQRAKSRPLGLAGLGFRGTGLAFDRTTGALWDLFGGGPISAPGATTPAAAPAEPANYDWLPLQRMTWRAWRRQHPTTLVLSQDTGYAFTYNVDPYAAAVGPKGERANYWTSTDILAPEALRVGDELMPDKSWVLGFIAGDEQWAAPVDELAAQPGRVEITTAPGKVTVTVAAEDDDVHVLDEQGKWLPQVRMFWFAWRTRFPQTKVWHPAVQES
jgi:hypothetical protein